MKQKAKPSLTPMNDEALTELAPWIEAVKKQCSSPVEYEEDLIKMLASDMQQ